MFNRLFGKGISKSTSSSMRDAVDSRGLEVTEDDPDTEANAGSNTHTNADS